MFDELLLLSEGHVMYFGKASAAVDYFASVGFRCPEQARGPAAVGLRCAPCLRSVP